MAESGSPENSEFRTSNDIRRAHVALMKRSLKASFHPLTRPEVVDFVNRLAKAGRRLHAEADRDEAQNTLDYWNATLVSMERQEGAPNAVTELEPFVRATDLAEHKGENPFRKIRLFGEDNRALISARADEIGKIVALVREKPIVLVTRAADTGRSALVMYGVVPRVEESLVAPRKAFILSSPSPEPLAGLARMAGAPESFGKELRRDPAKLRDRIVKACGGCKAVIIVDNLEDLFTSGVDAPTQDAFARAIAGAVAEPDVVRAILLVSEEHAQKVFELAALKPYAKDAARSPILPLSAVDVRRLVEALAKDGCLDLEGAVVEDLALRLQGDKSAFQLARFMLIHLWDLSQGGPVGWDEYAKLGRPDQALDRIAKRTFDSLSPQAQRAAERVFLALATPEGDRTAASRPVKRKELVAGSHATDERNATEEALAAFKDAGLLIESPGTGMDGNVEMVADRLMFNWERLDSWIRAARSKDERLPRLRGMALLWDKSGRKERYLLNEEESIREAREYLKDEPSDSVLAKFVEASEKFLAQRTRVELQKTRWLFFTSSMLAAIFLVGCVVFGYDFFHTKYMKARARPAINTDLEELRALSSKNQKQVYCNFPPDNFRQFYNLYRDNRNKEDQSRMHELVVDINKYSPFADPSFISDLHNIGFIDEDGLVDILKAKFKTRCTLFLGVDLSSAPGAVRDFADSSFNETVFIDTNFSGSSLAGSHFDNSEIFATTSFAGADLRDSEFRHTAFCGVDFSRALLNGMTLVNASMDDRTTETLRSTAWWQATGWTERQVEILRAEDGRNKSDRFRKNLKKGVDELITNNKTTSSGVMLGIIDAYNLARDTIQSNDLRRSAISLNNWAWELATNGINIAPSGQTKIDDLLSDDYCIRNKGVNVASLNNAAVSAKTALCLIGDSTDPLWPSTADTFAYVLLQSSQGASAQQRDRLLRAAIAYWTQPSADPLGKPAIPDRLFRLAIAESEAGSKEAEGHMTEAIKGGYQPSHEIVVLENYFDMKKYIKTKNDLGIVAHTPMSCPP
jgi:uncharacterized protein YjbI with pentapeptide repeats